MTQNRLILGITGFSQSGKDTLANRLVESHGFATYSFAHRLKQAAFEINPIIRVDDPAKHGLPLGLAEDSSGDTHLYTLQTIVNHIGMDNAKHIPDVGIMLQRTGTEGGWMIHGENVWVKLCERDFEQETPVSTPIVIPDLRFPHEERWLRERGGVMLRVVRPEQIRSSTRDPNHPSEKAQRELTPDAEIINDGTLAELHEKADAFACGLFAR